MSKKYIASFFDFLLTIYHINLFYLMSSNLLKECFFKVGEPPFASSEGSRNEIASKNYFLFTTKV